MKYLITGTMTTKMYINGDKPVINRYAVHTEEDANSSTEAIYIIMNKVYKNMFYRHKLNTNRNFMYYFENMNATQIV